VNLKLFELVHNQIIILIIIKILNKTQLNLTKLVKV